MNIDVLRSEVIKQFSSHWELNDTAHRIEHFLDVESCGNYINIKLGLGHDPKLILMVAFFHDLFAWSRVNHHLMSGSWIMETDHPLISILSNEERVLVSAGCREHRASGVDPFTCEFAEMMCSADRGFPTLDSDLLLERAIQFRMGKGLSRKESLAPSIQHCKEKYGSGGYARFPEIYLRTFSMELGLQRKMVDRL